MRILTPSLLITDDDRDFRETLQGVFEPAGFRTLLARHGEEALEIVRREPVHVAVFDMHMPRLTGLETIRRLRAALPLPCILLSAALDETIAREARNIEVFSVESKPISPRKITNLVREALRQAYGWGLESPKLESLNDQ